MGVTLLCLKHAFPATLMVSIHSTVADFAGWMSSPAMSKTGRCLDTSS